ncbi:30S ribosomal protein S6 [Patescibacteria group bacterium]
MNKYEMMTLTRGSDGEKIAKEVSKEVSELITSLEGKVQKTDFWGKRKLAYKIRQDTDAFYEVILFDFSKDQIDNLKSKLNLMGNLVRYIITAKS